MNLSASQRLVLTSVAGFAVILSASATIRAQRASRLVEGVSIIGNRRLSTKTILTHVKTKAGNRYSQSQVQRDFQALLDLGWFDKRGTRVSTESGLRGGVVVIFEVQELPRILEVTFEELGSIPETEVIAELRRKRVNLASETVYDETQVRRAQIVIQTFLALRGRSVSVDVNLELVTSMSIRVTFVIRNEARF